MLLHITKIEQAPAHHLRQAVLMPARLAARLPPIPWRPLPTIGLATLESTEETDNGTRTTTTTLTATLETPIPQTSIPQAYRLTTAARRTYLLGTPQAPFPLLTQETRWQGKSAETTATTLVITLKSPDPLLEIKK